jgi:tRNA modification GTPase
VVDASAPPPELGRHDEQLALQPHPHAPHDGDDGGGAAAPAGGAPPVQVLVLNKCDLAQDAGCRGAARLPVEQQWSISCLTQEGVQPFLAALGSLVAQLYGTDSREPPLVTRARHRQHLAECVAALHAFDRLAAMDEAVPLDLAAEELRTAGREVGRISGRIDVEDLLDVIFRDFCIGK